MRRDSPLVTSVMPSKPALFVLFPLQIVGGFVLTAFKEPEPVKSGKQD